MTMTTKKVKKLVVTTPQGVAGLLYHEVRYSFNYTSGNRLTEVSLLMPIRHESYASGILPGVFYMNRPEGFLLQKIMNRFAKHGGLNDMQLLSLVGNNQIGRLSYADPDVSKITQSKPQIGLNDLLNKQPTQALFDFLVETYLNSGISGVQPKVMVPDADIQNVDFKATVAHSNLIVKSGGEEYPSLTQNEFLCMDAARRSGIQVPDFWLSNDGGLFIMDRFDLSDGNQLGFEDMAILTGKQPDPHGTYKYKGSYENIATAITLFCRDDAADSKQRLFEYIALSVMVRNGDAHLKNFGLLYEHPASSSTPRLSPLYDVVTTSVYPHTNSRTGLVQFDRSLALKLNKEKTYPLRKTLTKFGSDICHVPDPESVIDRIATGMSESLSENKERINQEFFKLMSSEWDAGRMSVEPDRIFQSRPSTPRT
jgi:serine/threonine-protein kinase HipA